MSKWAYNFRQGEADGAASMKELLGGKGAGLAEMARLGLPVPPGFTLTTEVCAYFYAHDKTLPPDLSEELDAALTRLGDVAGHSFDDPDWPLLVSVRSGASRLDARHDGHRAQSRAQRQHRRRAWPKNAATSVSPSIATDASSKCIPPSCSASRITNSRRRSNNTRSSARSFWTRSFTPTTGAPSSRSTRRSWPNTRAWIFRRTRMSSFWGRSRRCSPPG